MGAQRIHGVCIFLKRSEYQIHIGRIGFIILRSSIANLPCETSEAMIGCPIVNYLLRRVVGKEFGVRVNWGRVHRIDLHGLATLHNGCFFILDPALVQVVENPFNISAGPLERSRLGGTLIIIQIHYMTQVASAAILIMLVTDGLGRHQPVDGIGSCWLCGLDDFWLIHRIHRQFPLPHGILGGLRRLAIGLEFRCLLGKYWLKRRCLCVLDKMGWGAHILDHAHHWDFGPLR